MNESIRNNSNFFFVPGHSISGYPGQSFASLSAADINYGDSNDCLSRRNPKCVKRVVFSFFLLNGNCVNQIQSNRENLNCFKASTIASFRSEKVDKE